MLVFTDFLCYFQVYGESLLKTCQYLLSDLRSEGIIIIMRFIELCLKTVPQLSCELWKPLIPQIMM